MRLSAGTRYILLHAVITQFAIAYGQIPFPEVIERIKPSIVAVSAVDDTFFVVNGDTVKYQSSGSGVLLAVSQTDVYALTNEHVIAIKDAKQKTVRHALNISVSLNLRGLGAISLPAKIRKVDENLDLVALRVFFQKSMKDNLHAAALPLDLWEMEANLREGETVLYSGYPWDLGRKWKTNYPLTRTGIVSQVVPGSTAFLIDAFVQHGYSGSPVFVIRSEPTDISSEWYFRFIGIASSFPSRMKSVYREVQYAEIPGVGVQENPGFANVIGVSAIKQLLGAP